VVTSGLAVLAVVTVLAACGSQTASSSDGAGSAEASPPVSTMGTVVDLDHDVVARGMLMQKSPTSDVELCVGGVLTSLPPQCGGPTVVGDVDWEALGPERGNGLTWSEGDVWAVGRLDPEAGAAGSLTLTRPLSLSPPEGVTPPPQLTGRRFPQLCDDPYAGGGRPGGGTDEAQNALSVRMETLAGYIGSWVSDGSSMFNVLVTGDPVAAHASLREIWKGGLCVEQRDLPTEAVMRSAQEAVSSVPGMLSSSGNAAEGRLEVGVVVFDAATHERILTAVEPWLDEEQVRVTSEFTALP